LGTALPLTIGTIGSLLMARRLRRQTSGLGPREIGSLLEQREAVLHSIREGVVVTDADNRISLMNDEAKRLGMRDTHYTSPSGVVDQGNYSTAWDLAAVTRMALRNATFRKIVRTKVVHVKWSAPTYSKIYVNNNSLLGSYPGANGVKTGFTHKAGWCLVSSATRRGRTLIAVVLNSGDMYNDTKKLLELGFRS